MKPPCVLAHEAAESIGAYCSTRFQSDVSEVLDIPWFADRVQKALNEAADENARLRAALEMIAQTRSVCGSAQGTFRTHRALVDAVLLGADVRELETVEAIVAGTWRKP